MQVLRRILHHATAFIFLVILLVLGASVFWRYALNNSIVWAEEFIRFAFIWMFFLAMPELSRRGAHLALDLLPSMLHGLPYRLLGLFIETCNMAFLLVSAYYSARMSIINMNQKTASLLIPYGTMYLAITIGSVLMALCTAERMHGLATGAISQAPVEKELD